MSYRGMSAAQRAEVDAELYQRDIARRRAPRAARLADDIRSFLYDGSPASYLITREESDGLEWLAASLDSAGSFEHGRMVNDINEEQATTERARLNAMMARTA